MFGCLVMQLQHWNVVALCPEVQQRGLLAFLHGLVAPAEVQEALRAGCFVLLRDRRGSAGQQLSRRQRLWRLRDRGKLTQLGAL